MAKTKVDTKIETRRSRYNSLWTNMLTERSSFETRWRNISDYLSPTRLQLYTSDTNRGENKFTNIINGTGLLAIRTLRAGMMGGITSPARPWFRLSTADVELSEVESVKQWLHTVTQRMTTAFLRSNLYNALPIGYGDLGTFGIGAIFIEEDFENVIRCYTFPVGSYAVANDDKGRIRTFFREFRMTVRQIIKRFGRDEAGNINLDNFSQHIKDAYETGQLESWIEVCHIIHENDDYDPKGLFSNQKRFRSVYYEKGSAAKNQAHYIAPDSDKFLSDKGYDYFPVLVPRWEVAGEDVYPKNYPGELAFGDTKSLQTMEKRKFQAIEKMVFPPMKAPTSLKNQKASILPGDITYYDERLQGQGFSPIHEVNPSVNELSLEIEKHERRISRAFYEDLFLMLATLDRRQITATEIEERHEEKLLALGPVLEQLNQDLLDPLIDITFDIMAKQGLLPEPPEELQGISLKVEYISIMHQAQKAAGLAGMDRLLSTAGELAGIFPDIIDKIDSDQVIDEYGEITGVPPKIIRSDEEVAFIREQRAELEKAQAQMAAMSEGAGIARDLSQADMGGDNALNRLIQQSEAGAPV